jgi:hypothetical protein
MFRNHWTIQAGSWIGRSFATELSILWKHMAYLYKSFRLKKKDLLFCCFSDRGLPPTMNQLLLRWKLDSQEEWQCLPINRVTNHTSSLLFIFTMPSSSCIPKAHLEDHPAVTTKVAQINAITFQVLPDLWDIIQPGVPHWKRKREWPTW